MNDRKSETAADERAPIGDRWVAGAAAGSPEARAGALLRQALRREPLDADRLSAIRERLHAGRRAPQPRRHWALRFAIAIALLLSGGALTAAGQRYLKWPAPARRAQPQAPAPVVPPARHARAVASAPALALAPQDELPAPSAPIPPPRSHGEGRSAPPPPPAVEPAAVTPPPAAPAAPRASALAQESKLLAEALRRLRQDDDPRGALAMLDEHDVLFTNGALAPEATLARIEALLKTRRNADALALLDGAAPTPHGSGRDLLIARAELRAAAGRCGGASNDFDLLLKGNPAFDPITERALWGRASCRAAASDGVGARGDLQDYLARFPDGRFARDARAALGL